MPPIRILIVDDSAVIRKIVADGLTSDPGLEVVGTAANGSIALGKIPQLHPDILTLDVEMPGMNGLETLVEVRKLYPKLPVIMFSTLTERGAATPLDALALGASDYAAKPSNTGSLDVTLKQIREHLIPKIKALCMPKGVPVSPAALPAKPQTVVSAVTKPANPEVSARIDLVAIGTSTGGPNALAELIPAIPGDFPVPIVIVQHMPPVFTRLLAGRLNEKSSLTVQEGRPGQTIRAGEAWIAPGDFHMVIERNGTGVVLQTNQDPPENSCRPAVDPLFRSVAQSFGPNALAIVLTGMGFDGVNGSQHIRERGGHVLIQDEASSVVWGMPGQVSAAGFANAVYSLKSMAQEIIRRVSLKRIQAPVAAARP